MDVLQAVCMAITGKNAIFVWKISPFSGNKPEQAGTWIFKREIIHYAVFIFRR